MRVMSDALVVSIGGFGTGHFFGVISLSLCDQITPQNDTSASGTLGLKTHPWGHEAQGTTTSIDARQWSFSNAKTVLAIKCT